MEAHPSWREIVTLALPVMVSKLSFTAMGLVDTAMVGRLGPEAQGAVGLAHTWFFTLGVLGLGVLSVVNTYVSQHHGAGRPQACGRVLGQSLRLAVITGGATMALLMLSAPHFGMAGQGALVSDLAGIYTLCRLVGMPGLFGYWVYNGYLEGLGRTRTTMRIALAANALNMLLDWLLIFGAGPIPALGVAGAGLATGLSNLFMLACYLAVVHRRGGPYLRFGAQLVKAPGRWAELRELLRTGLPMGLQFFMEVGAFMVFTVMIGWVGATALAASQVAMRLMSISFMTAWGISVAATTLVGRHQGEGRSDLADLAGRRTLLLTLVITAGCALLFVGSPRPLAALFTNNAEVASLAASLLYMAAIFQVFDGVNMVSYGALRGAGDTRWPMWVVAACSWGLGIPLVYSLAIGAELGVMGAWMGMTGMIACMSALLWLRFRSGRWRSLRLVP